MDRRGDMLRYGSRRTVSTTTTTTTTEDPEDPLSEVRSPLPSSLPSLWYFMLFFFLVLPFVCPQFLSCTETQSDLRAGGFLLYAREMFLLAQACNQRGVGRRQGCHVYLNSSLIKQAFVLEAACFISSYVEHLNTSAIKSTNSGMFCCRKPFLPYFICTESPIVHSLIWEHHKKCLFFTTFT